MQRPAHLRYARRPPPPHKKDEGTHARPGLVYDAAWVRPGLTTGIASSTLYHSRILPPASSGGRGFDGSYIALFAIRRGNLGGLCTHHRLAALPCCGLTFVQSDLSPHLGGDESCHGLGETARLTPPRGLGCDRVPACCANPTVSSSRTVVILPSTSPSSTFVSFTFYLYRPNLRLDRRLESAMLLAAAPPTLVILLR